MFQLPNLYMPTEDWPEEPLRTAFIDVIQGAQQALLPEVAATYFPVPPGKEIEILRLVATSYKIATDTVNPSHNATNGTPK